MDLLFSMGLVSYDRKKLNYVYALSPLIIDLQSKNDILDFLLKQFKLSFTFSNEYS